MFFQVLFKLRCLCVISSCLRLVWLYIVIVMVFDLNAFSIGRSPVLMEAVNSDFLTPLKREHHPKKTIGGCTFLHCIQDILVEITIRRVNFQLGVLGLHFREFVYCSLHGDVLEDYLLQGLMEAHVLGVGEADGGLLSHVGLVAFSGTTIKSNHCLMRVNLATFRCQEKRPAVAHQCTTAVLGLLSYGVQVREQVQEVPADRGNPLPTSAPGRIPLGSVQVAASRRVLPQALDLVLGHAHRPPLGQALVLGFVHHKGTRESVSVHIHVHLLRFRFLLQVPVLLLQLFVNHMRVGIGSV
mmetsp:Transcript_18245/g.25292  ORF Transcript_18245/g.25292 Transcript_18245/m.25292 type:complete len:298 (+) Transcript_18245:86-979(+)